MRAEQPHSPSTKIEISDSETPKIQTNTPGTAYHEEVHRAREIEFDESLAEKTRQEILKHYQIDLKHAISIPVAPGMKREIMAFSILENIKDPSQIYYADGHTAHAILLNEIFKRFPDIGIKSRLELSDDFFDAWKIKKGFIDPQRHGFKNFEHIHQNLANIAAQNREANELSEEMAKNIKNGKSELPNWFRNG